MTLLLIAGVVLLTGLAFWQGSRLCEFRQKASENRNVGEVILRNIDAYVLLIDNDFNVLWTNYYMLTGRKESKRPKVGNLLRCKNGEDAGTCGTHEYCANCPVRVAIGKAFLEKKNFSGLEVPMTLYTSDDNTASVECTVRVTGNFVFPEGKERLLLTIHDITDQKRIQQELILARTRAEESDRMKSMFLANTSHELRTPLNAILGFSELLVGDPSPEEKEDYVRIIRTNSELLLQLVRDILDLSKIEAGTLEYTYTEEELNTLFEELEGIYRMKQAKSSPVRIEFRRLYPSCRIRTDRQRLAQVLSNFLSNALKFTLKGEIVFGYEIRGEEIYFYTTDTGVGISSEEVGHLFRRFVKIGSHKQGVGIGLAISKSIVESMGGRIGAESGKGKGSTFWFVLPREAPQQLQ